MTIKHTLLFASRAYLLHVLPDQRLDDCGFEGEFICMDQTSKWPAGLVWAHHARVYR
jgi:hypothetical protein